MASNGVTLADEDGDFEDWIELYNFGEESVNLSGWGLSDDPDRPFRWTFPSRTIIGPGEFLLVWASGKNRPPVDGDAGSSGDGTLHTDFNISLAGDHVLLTRGDGTSMDHLEPTVIPRDVSIGRVAGEGDTWFFFDEPTPGGPNDTTAYASVLEPVAFSHSGGFHSEEFELSLSHPDPEAVIIYTLDGSTPDIDNLGGTTYLYKNNWPHFPGDPFGDFLENSYQSDTYESPIPITDRTGEPNKLAQISTTSHTEPYYLPSSPVHKGTVVQARAYKPGNLPSYSAGHTYFVEPDGNPYDLPILSLQIQEDLMFGYDDGIYTAGAEFDTWRQNNPNGTASGTRQWQAPYNWQRRGDDWEYPVRVEFFEPGAGEAGINQGAGFRIHGNASRSMRSKSMRLYARSQYDMVNEFEHRVFPNDLPFATAPDNDLFKRILVRGPGSGGPFLHEWVVHDVMGGQYEGMVRGRHVVKFVNGEFWGLTALRDRFDQHHLAYHFNLDPDNVIVTWGRGRGSTHGIDVGESSDLDLYHDMRSFILNQNMANGSLYQQAKDMLCMRSYVDHIIPMIYFANTHYETGFWRARDPSDEHFGDGRWRIYIQDFDWIIWQNRNSTNGELVPAFSNYNATNPYTNQVPILNNLLANQEFRHYFINRFADHLNTTFVPQRVESIVNETYFDILGPYLDDHEHRWGIDYALFEHLWGGNVSPDDLIGYAYDHPDRQRQHLRQRFGISNDAEVTLGVSDTSRGRVRVNTVKIDENTPGIDGEPYPWKGAYFQDVPIELEAVPERGYRLAGWTVSRAASIDPEDENSEFASTSPVITVNLAGNAGIEAVFEPVPLAERPIALHEWDFEDTETLLDPAFTLGGATLTLQPGPNTEVLPNTGGDFETQHLRVNNPLGSVLTFALPTSGYEEIALDFLTRRSGQGAGLQTLSYTTDGETWSELETYTVFDTTPQAQSFDFGGVAGVSDNPDFAVRIAFEQGEGGTAGNNRFDDVVLSGVGLPGTILPPVVREGEAPDRVALVAAGEPFAVELHDWFLHPNDEPMSFSAAADNATVLDFQVHESNLEVTGLRAGETVLRVSADDGNNPPAEVTVRVLVYPEPVVLSDGDYRFDFWSPQTPAGTYPDHMLLLQSDLDDPGLETDFLFAYQIPPEDAAQAEDVEFPYAASSRSRINGMDEAGLSFINTGRGRDLGAALLALDTTDAQDIRVSWTGGTVLPNSREYAIRLQYRLGSEGPWSDVTENGEPVEYRRHETADHEEILGPVALPEEVEGEALVQLQWRYYHVDGDSGPRARLRLDDILVRATPSEGTFAYWVETWFDEHEASDPGVSGPGVSASGDGFSNLLRYALGLGPHDKILADRLEHGVGVEGDLFLRFFRDPQLRDIVYLVESSLDLVNWDEVIYDSSEDETENGEAGIWEVNVEIDEEARRFLRLRIRLAGD